MKKGSQWRLYEYICRHFLATCMPDVEYTEHSLGIKLNNVSENDGIFSCVYHDVSERGYLFAMPWKADKFLNEQNPRGRFARGMSNIDLSAKDVKIAEGETEAPQYLKEGELIGLMDKHGIGTDASMAGHIDNVVTRNYAMVCLRSSSVLEEKSLRFCLCLLLKSIQSGRELRWNSKGVG